MAYTKQRSNWLDYPTTTTPILAANLNGLETAIYDLKYLTYNVKDYGAVGDGVANDTTAIAAAITAAAGTSGIVHLPRGTYLITASLSIPNGVELRGDGFNGSIFGAPPPVAPATTLKWTGATGGKMIVCSVTTGIQISVRDMFLDGNYTADYGLYLDGAQSGVFENLMVQQCNVAQIHLGSATATVNTQFNRFSSISCAAYPTGANGIRLMGKSSHGAFNSCHNVFSQVAISYAGDAIVLDWCDNNTFYGVKTFQNAGTGYGVRFNAESTSNYFYHFEGTAYCATPYAAGMMNAIYGYDIGNGQALPVLQASAILTHTVEGAATAAWYLPNPIRISNNVAFRGRNNANNADLDLFKCNTLDEMQVFSPFRASYAATFDSTLTANGSFYVSDAKDIFLGSTTGTKIGTATTQKLAFFNSTPVVQPSATGETVGFTAGGTAVGDSSTFTGNVGTKAYRISDVVKHLKNLGLIAAS